MRKYDQNQIIGMLRKVIEPVRSRHDYPHTTVNAAYLVYDLCQEFKIPENQIPAILGYRGYLHVARTRYYATPEGVAALEEALNAIADPFAEEADDE